MLDLYRATSRSSEKERSEVATTDMFMSTDSMEKKPSIRILNRKTSVGSPGIPLELIQRHNSQPSSIYTGFKGHNLSPCIF